MNETPMQRLPQKKVNLTIDEMVKELANVHKALLETYEVRHKDRPSFVANVAWLRAIADEILRWELL